MSRAVKSVDLLKCSFCGKNQRQVRKPIAGLGVYICNECIKLCDEIVTEGLESENSPSSELLPTPHEIFDFLQICVTG